MYDGKLTLDLTGLTDAEKDLLIEYKEQLEKQRLEQRKLLEKQKEQKMRQIPNRYVPK